MNDDTYSTQNVSPYLLEELKRQLESISDYGSLEIYVQDGQVTQISTKHIRKTQTVTNGSNGNGKSS